MRSASLAILFFLGTLQLVCATEQEPDILFYKSYKLKLETGWGHPSPLQTYYSQKDIEYPFSWYSTANYRGYVATWKIDNGKLFLTQISIDGKTYDPIQYQVASEDKSMMSKEKVFADWFSGVLVCNRTKKKSWNIIEAYYFYVREGEIIETAILNESDKKRIQGITERDTSNTELMNKYRMLFLNEKYITYYYRLNSKDTIEIGGAVGYLNRKKEGSPILSYFSNDNLKWPFSWENFEKSGAPNCKWTIRNDSIFLQEVGLLSSLSFNTVDKYIVSLQEVFSLSNSTNEIFADWLSGVFVVEYGKEVEDENLSGYIEFKPSEFVYYRISNGKILESESVLTGFNYREIPEDTPEHLKKMIEDY